MDYIVDEIENSPEYLAIKNEIDAEIDRLFVPGKLGQCHKLWKYKKQLLKNKYNIDWKSPAELNPEIIFE